MSMTEMEKSFSMLVFGDTLPNPTDVKLPVYSQMCDENTKVVEKQGMRMCVY
jgi:hypothetical protein